jgi:hypothetical protein
MVEPMPGGNSTLATAMLQSRADGYNSLDDGWRRAGPYGDDVPAHDLGIGRLHASAMMVLQDPGPATV